MRDILTGLAIILIVVLTTLLVAPYFVDWNGQRAFLETQLTRALGQPVTIGGAIDLKLLPTPYIRLNQTVIGGDEGPVRIGIHHLDLELAVAPLLHGEFDIVEGRLDEPTIRLTLQPDRTLPTLPETPALKADIRIERIAVQNGTLALADPASGHTFVLDHLDFTADAPSLAGPFKGSGAAGHDAGRTKFRFSTTQADKGRTHLHLALGETATHPGIDLDGDATLESPSGGGVRQSFAGTMTAIGQLRVPDGAPTAWRISGPLKIDPGGAKLSQGELRLGGEDGLPFKANIGVKFGATAAIDASFGAEQLDVDRLSGLPSDPTKPNPPPQLPAPSRLRALLAAATPPVRTTLDVTIDNATWGGEALSDITLRLKPNDARPDDLESGAFGSTLKASGNGPGGLQFAVDGTLSDGNTGFDGQARLGATDLPRAIAWLAAVAPDLAPSRGALPFAEAELGGEVNVDAAGLVAKDATLDLDRTQLRGSLKLAYGDATRQPRLTADLRAPTLDLDTLPTAGALGRGAAQLAFDLKLAADSARIATFGTGALEAGHVTLDMSGRAGGVDLRTLRVENLGGATLTATGKLDGRSASIDAKIDADRLEAAAALARQVAPGDRADALVARSKDLAPAHMDLQAVFATAEPGGPFEPSRLKLEGTLSGTKVAASLSPDETGKTAEIAARADNADGLALLRQLGLPISQTSSSIGGGALTLSASGELDGPLASRIDARFGATHLSVDGRYEFLGKAEGGSGKAELKSPDLGPLLRGLGLISPDAANPLPADLTGALAVARDGLALSDIKGRSAGTGVAGTLKLVPPSDDTPILTGTLDLDRLALGSIVGLALGPGKPPAAGIAWSNEAFAAPASIPRAQLSLRARTLDIAGSLAATGASLDLRLRPGLVAVSHGEASLYGGYLAGAFSLRRDGRQATMEGSLTVDDVALDLPALKAGVSGRLDLAGGGGTPLALVTSLAGSGTATLTEVTIPDADPAALSHVFAAVENDALAVDEEAVTRAFDESAKAPLSAGTRHVTLGLASGALTLGPADEGAAAPATAASAAKATSEIDAKLDLRTMHLAVQATETLRALPPDWSGPPPSIVVTQAGPIAAPHRSFAVAAFLNAVAARAIARESARVEAYEFDIRERAIFNTRLMSEHRREQDRVKAEADAKAAAEAARRAAAELARKAEAERRAKAEAARVERQRSDEAAQTPAPPAPGSQEAPRFRTPPPGATSDPSAAGRY